MLADTDVSEERRRLFCETFLAMRSVEMAEFTGYPQNHILRGISNSKTLKKKHIYIYIVL